MPATASPTGKGLMNVKLNSPRHAITPGQAVVFYQDDLVVGDGWISR
jgi:tRNA-specific 2-thiouridylase